MVRARYLVQLHLITYPFRNIIIQGGKKLRFTTDCDEYKPKLFFFFRNLFISVYLMYFSLKIFYEKYIMWRATHKRHKL